MRIPHMIAGGEVFILETVTGIHPPVTDTDHDAQQDGSEPSHANECNPNLTSVKIQVRSLFTDREYIYN